MQKPSVVQKFAKQIHRQCPHSSSFPVLLHCKQCPVGSLFHQYPNSRLQRQNSGIISTTNFGNSVTLKLTRLTLTCAATRNGETTTTHVDLTRYVIGMCILHGYSVTRKSNTFNNGFVINRWRGNFRSLLLIPLGLYTGEQTAACCTQALVYPKSLLELRLFIFGKLEMYRITDSD